MEIATLSAHPMDELKNRLRLILNVIPPGSNIYYIDYPVYSNGGDLLIMKGTEAFFRENGIRVRARYSAFDFPDGLSVPKDHILVLQGGGNFGDLYPVHQKLRERVVAGYPNNRVVILPQTIHYKDVREFDRTADILNRHKDVHLFVRDTLSLDMAKDKFHRCGVYLSPDMAHQLWPIRGGGQPARELLRFMRTDIEKTEGQDGLPVEGAGDVLDWSTLYSRTEHRSIRAIGKVMRISKGKLPVGKFWIKYSDRLVSKAVERFAQYRTVQTSRLHGHILSCLMDKPNVLYDNAYGKNGRYYRTWTQGIVSAKLAAEPSSKQSGGMA
ncbi:polysaccharide pyruvyl transferase family protein [Cohnella rhizosphaerae]|uniref:Polysaccharide pyruvyl transferase family protein n=1 Tax=Cohnella rhizosphaerae TaxID=1457232 RepID=A0A9X4QRC2_9BACL|nr:polysaccharide pyruvyl transferase family protein [Cohnella rhizosphaerae]MDG0808094.1 polysaccharide pyruvyl transferase family protein [Cohnella rhizosphaerae]